MNPYALIKNAVINRQQVVATYHGHVREMCPHVLGRKSGRGQCLFFQFAGGSTTGLPAGGEWRCLSIDELTDVTVRTGPWHTGARHSRPQTCVGEIDVEVDY